MHKIHHLKCWPRLYEDQVKGLKPFDLRLDDRGYQVGDFLVQQEWAPQKVNDDGTHEGVYTGREACYRITYKLIGWGLKERYCALTLQAVPISYKDLVQLSERG